jgi:flagellar biosynthetic protein FliO
MELYISTIGDIAQLITVLLIFLFVLLLAWLSTRFIGRFHQGTYSQKNIKVIETYPLGGNKMLAIIKVGKKYALISVGKDSVTHVMDLDGDDFCEITPGEQVSPVKMPTAFDEIFKKLKIPTKMD